MQHGLHGVSENTRLNRIRRSELEVFADVIWSPDHTSPESITIVEIGGGSGYLAKQLAAGDLRVFSYDPSPREPLEFPVQEAFGHDLPVDDGIADIVVAAHVMEHIPEQFLGPTFDEIRRVLKPSGKAIILLPTSAAMFFTILLQPMGNFMRLLIHLKRLLGGYGARKEHTCNNPLLPRGESFTARLVKSLTLRWFLPAPHGVGRTALHELWNWRRSNWTRTFARCSFLVLEVRSSGLAVSNHQLMGERLWFLRTILGRLEMGGSNVFVLRPNPR